MKGRNNYLSGEIRIQLVTAAYLWEITIYAKNFGSLNTNWREQELLSSLFPDFKIEKKMKTASTTDRK